MGAVMDTVMRARPVQRSGRHNARPRRVLARILILTITLLAAGWTESAAAQSKQPTITAAARLAVEPATPAPLAIRVGPAEAIPPGCFVRLRGLPSTAALSEGHSIAPGAWAVPLAALRNLKVLLPPDATGQSDISITLVSADGSVLADTNATLVVTVAPASPGRQAPGTAAATVLRAAPLTQPPPAAQPPEAQPAGPMLSPEARERAQRLVKKGDEQLAEGGVAQARLLYERAADAGLALGAMAMAATYDPAELTRLGVLGLKADREAARRWYERARQLGATEAEQRLRRLGAN
jgi:hypothetical protein